MIAGEAVPWVYLCPHVDHKSIAHATGFGSPSHFSNTFRKAFGVSPKAYLAELGRG